MVRRHLTCSMIALACATGVVLAAMPAGSAGQVTTAGIRPGGGLGAGGLNPSAALRPSHPAGAVGDRWTTADGQATPSRPALRSAIDVVTVTATVVDAAGHLVTGLSRDDFLVFDDSEEQPITQFVSERVPVSLAILLDVSDSMTGKRMDDARSALDRFLTERLSEEDEAFVGVFNHRPRMITPWTLRPAQLQGSLDGVIPTGGTAIYDAVAQALPRFSSRAHQRAAMVVISDGADTASDTDLRTLRSALRRSDAFVYAIAIDPPQRARINTAVDPAALRAVTDDSGGFTEIVRDTADLGSVTERIANELNSQYLIGYVSPHPDDGGYHSVRVKTKNPELRVRSRKGYMGVMKKAEAGGY